MENLGDMELQNLINELAQGRELANKLKMHVNSSSSSQENGEILVNKMIDSFDKVLSMVGCGGGKESDSSRSFSRSPRSPDSDMEFKDQNKNGPSKKSRKAMPRWSKQVQISSGAGHGALDDSYSWRKYGQKDILGAKYPRGYYRCTHRHAQGCLATKQVQRSDNDPTIFHIIYRGIHSCNPNKNLKSPPPTKPPQKQEPNTGGGLQQDQNQPFLDPLFHFSSPSSSEITHQNFDFSTSFMDDSQLFSANFTPSIEMPPTSSAGSSGFFQVNNFHGNNVDLQISEHEAVDRTSATTSTMNSPAIGLDYAFSVFGQNFTFDNQGFFS